MAHRSFARRFEALADVFAFTAEFFATHAVDPQLRPTIDLAVEELFTNMVKYSPAGSREIRIDISALPGGVEVTLIESEVERFDVTRDVDVDLDLPIEQRTPGGLGLHLIRRLVDAFRYEYFEDSRQSRTTFRKMLSGPAGPGG